MKVEELMDLGFTPEEAAAVNHTQSYEPPTDPLEIVRSAHRSSNYDKERGLLNLDLAEGRIDEDKYWELEAELYTKYNT